MTATANIWQQFRRLPRAFQWLVYAVVGVVLYFGYETYVLQAILEWNLQAQEIQADIERFRAGDRIATWLGRRGTPVVSFGPVNVPGNEEEGAAALNRAVNNVLTSEAYSISGDTFDSRPGGRLKAGALPTISGGERVEYVKGEFKFEASPSDAIAIIAELESNPEIMSVRDIHIRKSGVGRVSIRLALETWVISRSGSL